METPASIIRTARGTINTRFSRMVLRAELPKSLIASNFERYDPNRQGGRVPIRFVPEQEKHDDEKITGKASTSARRGNERSATLSTLFETQGRSTYSNGRYEY